MSVTAVAFTLIFQAVSGWLTYPEVTVRIAAVGCFVFPVRGGGADLERALQGKSAGEQTRVASFGPGIRKRKRLTALGFLAHDGGSRGKVFKTVLFAALLREGQSNQL